MSARKLTKQQRLKRAVEAVKPYVYLSAFEHYDVPPSAAERRSKTAGGETWSRAFEEILQNPEDVYVVQINTGGYTGVNAVVYDAKHPDSALEAADDWAAGFYYGGDNEAMHYAGEGPIRVDRLRVNGGNGNGNGNALAKALKGRR